MSTETENYVKFYTRTAQCLPFSTWLLEILEGKREVGGWKEEL